MLSDNKSKQRNKSPVKKKDPGASKAHYSDSQKMDLVKTYLVTGNLMTACATLNIPYITGKFWKKSEWWDKLTTDIKTEDSIHLSDKLKKIINKSLAITEDRLENGDYIYDSKIGELVKKPVSMKDAHKVSVDLIDRRILLENRPVESTSQESVVAKLDAIAEKFAQLAKAKPAIEVTDVIIGTECELPPKV